LFPLGRKSYSLLKYFFVLLIVLGVALFMYKDKAGSKGAAGGEEGGLLGLGELLLILSLACDGITGAIQVPQIACALRAVRMRSETKSLRVQYQDRGHLGTVPQLAYLWAVRMRSGTKYS
jgi:hypothetical protein